MTLLCYRRHRFPPEIIQHAIWLYLRFTLTYRDVEELLAGRGLEISYETVRRWVLKFGPSIARRLPIPMVPHLGSIACTESSRLPAACESEFSEGTAAFPRFFLKGKSERGS
jgi:transposase-like protein